MLIHRFHLASSDHLCGDHQQAAKRTPCTVLYGVFKEGEDEDEVSSKRFEKLTYVVAFVPSKQKQDTVLEGDTGSVSDMDPGDEDFDDAEVSPVPVRRNREEEVEEERPSHFGLGSSRIGLAADGFTPHVPEVSLAPGLSTMVSMQIQSVTSLPKLRILFCPLPQSTLPVRYVYKC